MGGGGDSQSAMAVECRTTVGRLRRFAAGLSRFTLRDVWRITFNGWVGQGGMFAVSGGQGTSGKVALVEVRHFSRMLPIGQNRVGYKRGMGKRNGRDRSLQFS